MKITHELSSANSPESNGESEAGVQIVKALVKKAKEDITDVQLLIVSHNLAQRADGSGSPAEIFFKCHC